MAFLLRDFEKIVCFTIFAAMTLLGFTNVVVRYLTNYSLAASEELLINGFLLLTVFGAAIAARNGEHLAVTILYEVASRRARKFILALSTLLSAGLLALSAWFTLALLLNEYSTGMRSYALQLPAWYYSVALPFGFALILVRYIQHAREEWRGRDTMENALV